ncbi:hypothetical protein F5Y18DRAFT_253290 [Xylariaceae sp. FL1019]|nr:hypothetical protein F5Y18DRAFT_253290 [Xylariaceae sp. FL1019]
MGLYINDNIRYLSLDGPTGDSISDQLKIRALQLRKAQDELSRVQTSATSLAAIWKYSIIWFLPGTVRSGHLKSYISDSDLQTIDTGEMIIQTYFDLQTEFKDGANLANSATFTTGFSYVRSLLRAMREIQSALTKTTTKMEKNNDAAEDKPHFALNKYIEAARKGGRYNGLAKGAKSPLAEEFTPEEYDAWEKNGYWLDGAQSAYPDNIKW